jgi:uncharacterized OsmC-like protein
MNAMTAAQVSGHTNGVDLAALMQTIDAIRQDEELAQFRFRAENRWLDGGHNRSTIQGFHGCRAEDTTRRMPFVLDADEPPVLLGRDQGANPVEFVLHALVACLTTSMAYHAAARGMAIRRLESHVEGDLDLRGFLGLSDEVRKGYRSIRVQMRAQSEAPPEMLRECAMFSPVYDIVSRSVPVELSIETY